MFDPWSADLSQAVAEELEWDVLGKYSPFPFGRPLDQHSAVAAIEALRDTIENDGDGCAVLAAIDLCVTRGLVAPDWLAHAFNRRYESVLKRQAKSWDDPLVFGSPYPKGYRLAAERKRRNMRGRVWDAVNKKIEECPDVAIGKVLFEEVGESLKPPLGGTLVGDYYYEHKKMMDIFFGDGASEVMPKKFRKSK